MDQKTHPHVWMMPEIGLLSAVRLKEPMPGTPEAYRQALASNVEAMLLEDLDEALELAQQAAEQMSEAQDAATLLASPDEEKQQQGAAELAFLTSDLLLQQMRMMDGWDEAKLKEPLPLDEEMDLRASMEEDSPLSEMVLTAFPS